MTGAPDQPGLPLVGGAGRQLALPLGGGPDDVALLVTDSNRAVVAVLQQPEVWPSRALILRGPRRSGRSLHARLAATRGARVLDRADRRDEGELFAAWNAAQGGAPLLLLADAAPPAWTVELPDLRTRLAASGVATLPDPDDALADALLELMLRRSGVTSTPTLRAEALLPVERTHYAVERLASELAGTEALTRATIARAHEVLGVARLVAA